MLTKQLADIPPHLAKIVGKLLVRHRELLRGRCRARRNMYLHNNVKKKALFQGGYAILLVPRAPDVLQTPERLELRFSS